MASEVNNITFNQDFSCFACALKDGLRIYNTDPLREKLRLTVEQVGSLSKVSMLQRTNWIALLSGPPRPKFNENIIIIWNAKEQDFSIEYKFNSIVLDVQLGADKLVAVLSNSVYVCSFPKNSQKLMEISTLGNPLGICQFVATISKQRLVTLGQKLGCIQIHDVTKADRSCSVVPVNIKAHTHDIACVAINLKATIVATASVQGTLVRLFDLTTGRKVLEVRRGSDRAKINCINFSKDSAFFCVSSDKGTTHIFAIKDGDLNVRSKISKAGVTFNKYTESKWSFSKISLDDEVKVICCFGTNNTLLVVCYDGSLHKFMFKLDGTINRSEYDIYLHAISDDLDF